MPRKPGSLNKTTLLKQALQAEGLDAAAIAELLTRAKIDSTVYTSRGIAVKGPSTRAKKAEYTPPTESPVGEPVAPQ